MPNVEVFIIPEFIGTAASRPAASAVTRGAYHYATDTNVLSQADGIAIWTTIDIARWIDWRDRYNIESGSGRDKARIGGSLHVNTGSIGTDADTLEKTLMSYDLKANSFNQNGRGVRINAWGTFANNVNIKSVRLYFGATVLVINDITTTPMGGDWHFTAMVLHNAANSQEAIGFAHVQFVSQSIDRTAPTENQAADITIKVTGQNGTAAANEIVCEALLVEFIA